MTCSCAVALPHRVHTDASGKGLLPHGVALRGCSHITEKVNVESINAKHLWQLLTKLHVRATSQAPPLPGPRRTLTALLETCPDCQQISAKRMEASHS